MVRYILLRAPSILITVSLLPKFVSGYCFEDYTQCCQNVLYSTVPPSCDFGCGVYDTLPQTNECLCNDGDLQKDLAQQFYASCGCEGLMAGAQMWVASCNATGTPSVMGESAIIAAGEGHNQECQPGIDPTTTRSTTSQSSSNDSWSTRAKVGLAVGCVVGGAFLSFLLAVCWDVFKWKREAKQNHTSSRPTSQLFKEGIRTNGKRIKTTTQSIGSLINCCSFNGRVRYHSSNTNAGGLYRSRDGNHDDTDNGHALDDLLRPLTDIRNTNTTREV